MTNYVIMLRDEEDLPGGLPRRDLYERILNRVAAFRERLRLSLEVHRMTDVELMGEAIGFPIVPIRCTPLVADLMNKLREVECVLRDSDADALSLSKNKHNRDEV